MAAAQADYVQQNAEQIEKLLREVSNGAIDKDVEKHIRQIEKKHGELNDVGRHRNWSTIRSEMILAGRKLRQLLPKEIREIQKSREYFRLHGGLPSRRKASLDNALSKLGFINADLDRNLHGLSRMELPSAGFDNTKLQPLVGERYFTLLHPGKDGGVAPAPFRFTGPENSEVTIEMEHVRGLDYGGHNHQISPAHLGSFRNLHAPKFEVENPGKLRFTMRPAGETTVWYLASDLCTRRKFTVTHSWPGAQLRYVLLVDVRYAKKLYDLNDYNLRYVTVTTGDDTHPDSVCHYGSREMIDALEKLSYYYGRALESGEFDEATTEIGADNSLTVAYRRPSQTVLWVNDISLPWGGRFRNKGKMNGKSHLSHKWGNDVDINWSGMNNKQRQWMWTNAPDYFEKVDTHNEGEDNEHWHLDVIIE